MNIANTFSLELLQEKFWQFSANNLPFKKVHNVLHDIIALVISDISGILGNAINFYNK